MTRLVLAALLGLSLSLSPVAAPQARAQMSNEQVGQLLAALAAIGVLGVAIDKYKDDRKDKKKREQLAHERQRIHRPDGHRDYRQPRAEHHRGLPARCLRQFETPRGARQFYGKRCLQRHYHRADALPRFCERVVRNHNGRDTVAYGVRCLRRQGWTVAQRH